MGGHTAIANKAKLPMNADLLWLKKNLVMAEDDEVVVEVGDSRYLGILITFSSSPEEDRAHRRVEDGFICRPTTGRWPW